MPKKNPENKFKKLVLTWWVWIIVAVVSYFLMILTPVQSQIGVFLAYLTQIAWVIVVVLLLVNLIKWIQETKIKDIWKISLTILGIVGIIAYIFVSFSGIGLFDDTENKIKKSLEEDNYEVIEVNYFEEFLGNESLASVDMKSFGDLNEQARDGLTRLGIYYKNADSYSVTIFTPTSKCYYSIDGAILNPYLNEDELDETAIIESLDFQIWENYILNKEPDFYDISLYKNIDETGFDSLILSSIIDYKIEEETKTCS